jgi:ligand-binding SRPBCC domain-containing protein
MKCHGVVTAQMMEVSQQDIIEKGLQFVPLPQILTWWECIWTGLLAL